MATTNGCEIVCPCPIGRAPSSYACGRSSRGTKSSRGTRAIASRTRSSVIPRRRSCRSTMLARASATHAARAHFASVREPGEASGLASAHARGQERERDREDVAGERHERDQADRARRARPCTHRPRSASRRDGGRRRRPPPRRARRESLRRRPRSVSGVPAISRPIAPPSAAPTIAAAPMPRTCDPRIPVIATDSPSPSPRQSPIVYQLPTRPVYRAGNRTIQSLVLHSEPSERGDGPCAERRDSRSSMLIDRGRWRCLAIGSLRDGRQRKEERDHRGR